MALGELGDPRAVEPLIAALKDEKADVNQAASGALARLGEPALEPLVAALEDEDGRARAAAARALGLLGDVRAIGSLLAALGDEEAHVEASAALARLGEPAVEPLIAALKGGDPITRRSATIALGLGGDRRAIEPLTAALKDDDRQVRQDARAFLDRLS
jgi:HEAT repeat protein